MIEKVGHVKNPLSIIAIFAGIAEVFGTGVLPFIEVSNQRLFIWFLMLFPAYLVSLFFLTLWLKHQVLYAPSDYKDEGNFMGTVRPASASHTQEKREQELLEVQESAEPPSDGKIDEGSPEGGMDAVPSAPSSISNQQYAVLEGWAISKLQEDFQTPILRSVKLPGSSDYIFDGVVNENGTTNILEIKIVTRTTRQSIVESWAKALNEAIWKSYDGRAMSSKIRIVMILVSQDGDLPESKQNEILKTLHDGLRGFSITAAFLTLDAFRKETGIALDMPTSS